MLNFNNVLYGEGPLFILICKFYILSALYLMALSVNIIQYHNTNLNRIQYHNPWRVLWSDKGNDCCFSSLKDFYLKGTDKTCPALICFHMQSTTIIFCQPCLPESLLNQELKEDMLVSQWTTAGIILSKDADV